MKNLRYIVLLSAILITMSSFDTEGVKNPDKIGTKVMKILSSLDNINLETYSNNFVTIDEIHKISKNTELVTKEKGRKEMMMFSQEDRDKGIKKWYGRIMNEGEKAGINWKDIEFVDFNYEVKSGIDWGTGCGGNVFFRSEGKTYRIKIFYLFDGKKYLLAKLSSLMEVTE